MDTLHASLAFHEQAKVCVARALSSLGGLVLLTVDIELTDPLLYRDVKLL